MRTSYDTWREFEAMNQFRVMRPEPFVRVEYVYGKEQEVNEHKTFDERIVEEHPKLSLGIFLGICVLACAIPTTIAIKYSAKQFSKNMAKEMAKNGIVAIVNAKGLV